MICCFCSAHLDTQEEAVLANWIPSFWHVKDTPEGPEDEEMEGPICPTCAVKYLVVDAFGDWFLGHEGHLPALAIPLKRHPNMRS